jgi:hypothetical protein
MPFGFLLELVFSFAGIPTEFLKTPMSGFHLPQFVIIDQAGVQRQRCIPCGDDYWEVMKNLRFPIEALVDERLAPKMAQSIAEAGSAVKVS